MNDWEDDHVGNVAYLGILTSTVLGLTSGVLMASSPYFLYTMLFGFVGICTSISGQKGPFFFTHPGLGVLCWAFGVYRKPKQTDKSISLERLEKDVLRSMEEFEYRLGRTSRGSESFAGIELALERLKNELAEIRDEMNKRDLLELKTDLDQLAKAQLRRRCLLKEQSARLDASLEIDRSVIRPES